MWQLASVSNPTGASLWFTDGLPIATVRGGSGSSSRLIVGGQGFLDVTDFQNGFPNGPVMDFVNLNGVTFDYTPSPQVDFDLELPGDGVFKVQKASDGSIHTGQLKPLPAVSAADISVYREMMDQNLVPYPDIPGGPGKTTAQIEALGLQFFPWSPYSFELAMSIYNWTTACFTRMVLLRIFGYSGVGQPPHPLDQASIAAAIWESDWGTYTPQDVPYMASFLMTPAESEADVLRQLENVAARLQQYIEVENRLAAAAFQAMPRTSVTAMPLLYSGQLDIYQLGVDHFGIEFLECPLNDGPIGTPLTIPFQEALQTYCAPGKVLTTKMVWSFGDSMAEAMKYQNGIVLVVNPPRDDWVWDAAAYITPLSDEAGKIEYVFAPGTQFEVQSIRAATESEHPVTIISMQVV